MTADEVSESKRLFTVWDSELRSSGGPYLIGKLSLADLAFVPTVLRILSHEPSLEQWPLTRSWAERLIFRASVKKWLDEAVTLPVVRLNDYRL